MNKEGSHTGAWEEQPEHSFNPSCCDGPISAEPTVTPGTYYQGKMSSQPCGCDKGANYTCAIHQGMFGIADYEKVITEKLTPHTSSPTVVQDYSKPCGCCIGWMCDDHRNEDNKAAKTGGAATLRKEYPIATGVLDYFPKAITAVAHVSYVGNQQHHPDKPLHWDRSKSSDEADALMRHFTERGTLDTDGLRHTAKVAWRALAMLEKELERG